MTLPHLSCRRQPSAEKPPPAPDGAVCHGRRESCTFPQHLSTTYWPSGFTAAETSLTLHLPHPSCSSRLKAACRATHILRPANISGCQASIAPCRVEAGPCRLRAGPDATVCAAIPPSSYYPPGNHYCCGCSARTSLIAAHFTIRRTRNISPHISPPSSLVHPD